MKRYTKLTFLGLFLAFLLSGCVSTTVTIQPVEYKPENYEIINAPSIPGQDQKENGNN